MSATPRTQSHGPAAVTDAILLFDRFTRLTAEALAALERDEAEALAPLLDQRQEVLHLTGPILRGLGLLRQRSGDTPPAALAAALAEVERVGRAAAERDAELSQRLRARRDEVAAELAHLDRGSAARTAYARAG